jgi:hypothetical protein
MILTIKKLALTNAPGVAFNDQQAAIAVAKLAEITVVVKDSLWLAVSNLNLLHGLADTCVSSRGKYRKEWDDSERCLHRPN